jgi:FkbM family methyltransferase
MPKAKQPASTPAALIKLHFPEYRPVVIFDVGANIGGSCAAFARVFPDAEIYAFEPVASVYRKLQASVGKLPRAHAFNVALGRRPDQVRITKKPGSTSNRVVDAPTVFERRNTESVAMTSGEAFCAEHGIDHIGFLKIDAEGLDLDVLIGFQPMLAAGRIDILETEVGMNRENRRHVPFEAVKSYLEPLGYHLFFIHDLAMDTPFSGRVVLRRANTMFVSDAFVETNRVEHKKAP